MKTKGTSKFVRDLLETWLAEIHNMDTLNQLEQQVIDRKAKLMQEQNHQAAADCVEAMKRCKHGDTLYLLKPFPMPSLRLQTSDKNRDKYREDMNRLRCKFWKWHPRAKRLWVTVPWVTSTKKYGKHFIQMTVSDIERLQPSRTEAEIRLRQTIGRRP